jgi:hypothetical protein
MMELHAEGPRGFALIVLETVELESLKKGVPIECEGRPIIITWTPDPEWLRDKIGGKPVSPDDLVNAIKESHGRPQAPLREPHDPVRQEIHLKPEKPSAST